MTDYYLHNNYFSDISDREDEIQMKHKFKVGKTYTITHEAFIGGMDKVVKTTGEYVGDAINPFGEHCYYFEIGESARAEIEHNSIIKIK